jgi:dihydroflavonol-4-reductase
MALSKPSQILVTGGSGLVGSFLIAHLIQLGHPVRALFRGQIPNIPFSDQVEWVEGDILDTSLVRQAVQGQQFVFHAAGLVSYSPYDEDLLQRVNVEGVANMVNACLAEGPLKFCHVSSIAAIGRPKGVFLLDEEARWDSGGDHSVYGRSKYFGELEVWRGIAEGLDAIIVNPSLVLGPADWNRSSTQLFKYVYDQHTFYTRSLLNVVDVRDVVELMVHLMFSPNTGERFILNQGSYKMEEFFGLIANNFQKKPPSVVAPPWLMELVWRMEMLRSFFTRKKPLITKETVRLAKKEYQFNSLKVQHAMNFSFRPLAETIRWTAEGLLEEQQKNHILPE